MSKIKSIIRCNFPISPISLFEYSITLLLTVSPKKGGVALSSFGKEYHWDKFCDHFCRGPPPRGLWSMRVIPIYEVE